jgi:hypothetical protein
MGKRIVRHLEQVPVLRIDLLRFTRAHAEGGCVEAPDVVDHAGGEGVAPSNLVGGRVKVRLGRKTVRSDLADAATIVAKQLPEFVAVPSTREAAGVADDGDLVATCHSDACLPAYFAVVFDRTQVI